MNRFKGFTLIELMVVLAILAIDAFIADPSFTNLVRDNRTEAQAETLNSLFQYARSDAVIRKIDTFVTLDASSGDVQITADSVNGDVLRNATLDLNNINLTASSATIGFRPNGTTTTPGFEALVCGGGDAGSARLLTVSGSGAATLHNKGKKADGTDLGSC